MAYLIKKNTPVVINCRVSFCLVRTHDQYATEKTLFDNLEGVALK